MFCRSRFLYLGIAALFYALLHDFPVECYTGKVKIGL